VLSASGNASLASDTLVLNSSGEWPNALSIFLQGSAVVAPVVYGDGLRCAGGTLYRLYTHNASAGVATAPLSGSGDQSISATSAASGDIFIAGSTRYYQTYYRDPSLVFCPAPAGDVFNISSGLTVIWEP
jgi:hypothetical protein